MRVKRWDFGDYYDFSQNSSSNWMDYSHDSLRTKSLSAEEIIFYGKAFGLGFLVFAIFCTGICLILCGPISKGCSSTVKLCRICCNSCKDVCCCYDPAYRILKEGAIEMGLEMPSYDEYALWRDSIKHGTKQMIKEEMQNDPKSVLQALARRK